MDKQSQRLALIGIFAALITLVVGIACAGPGTLSGLRFWSVLGPLLLSEILLTVSTCRLVGKSKDKAFPVLFSFVIIPVCYFVFTLFMIVCYGIDEISDSGLLIIQVIVLFLVLLVVVFMQMAADTVKAHATETAIAEAARTNFRATVFSSVETLRTRFQGDKELAKLFDKLYDAARYAADSVPGVEKVEEELDQKLMNLESSAETVTAEELPAVISPILSLFRKRETILKSLR